MGAVISRVTVSKANAVVKASKTGSATDLAFLDASASSEAAYSAFSQAWEDEKALNKPVAAGGAPGSGRQPSLFRALRRTFVGEFIRAALLKLVWGALLVLSASYFVRQLLRWLGAYNAGTAPQRDGWILSCFFFLCCWLLSVALQQMNLVSARMGLRVRAAVATAVYRKSLTVSLTDKRGDALALVATDCAKLQDAVQSVNYLWSGVLEALAIFGVLIGFVGKSALPGLGLLLVLLPFQYFLGTLGAKLRKKTVAASDDRVSLMDEILRAAKMVKAYAWEDSFARLVAGARKRETDVMAFTGVVKAINLATVFVLPPLTALAIFGVLSIDADLDSVTAFTTLSLFNTLRLPLVILPKSLRATVEAMSAMARLQEYLLVPDARAAPRSEKPAIAYADATFTYGPPTNPAILRGITLTAKPGELVMVCGAVGSGKSNLIHSILGGMTLLSGSASVGGRLAYVPQTPWCQFGTVRDNILFGQPMDEVRYRSVVFATSLLPDFEIMEQGDQTMIGERGVNVSGGQKARIALARAAYSNADVLLLDSPLAAVDNFVGQHIVRHLLRGLLRGKLIVLITHALEQLAQADTIVIMKDGRPAYVGPYSHAVVKDAFGDVVSATPDVDTHIEAAATARVEHQRALTAHAHGEGEGEGEVGAVVEGEGEEDVSEAGTDDGRSRESDPASMPAGAAARAFGGEAAAVVAAAAAAAGGEQPATPAAATPLGRSRAPTALHSDGHATGHASARRTRGVSMYGTATPAGAAAPGLGLDGGAGGFGADDRELEPEEAVGALAALQLCDPSAGDPVLRAYSKRAELIRELDSTGVLTSTTAGTSSDTVKALQKRERAETEAAAALAAAGSALPGAGVGTGTGHTAARASFASPAMGARAHARTSLADPTALGPASAIKSRASFRVSMQPGAAAAVAAAQAGAIESRASLRLTAAPGHAQAASHAIVPVGGSHGAAAGDASTAAVPAMGIPVSSDPHRPARPVKQEARINGYHALFSTVGYVLLGVSLSIFIFTQLTRIFSDIWISGWVTRKYGRTEGWYLEMYSAYVSLFLVLLFVRGYYFYTIVRRGVSVMHDRMFRAILRAPLAWFTVTPIGRVLSTFSRDQDSLDEALPDAIMMVTIYVMILGTTLGVVIRVLPVFAAVAGALAIAFGVYFRLYIRTSRAIKAACSDSLSLLVAHVSESLQGMTVIRAFEAEPRFAKDNLARLEASQRASQNLDYLQVWLQFRLDTIGSLLVFGVCLLCTGLATSLGPSSAGLAVSNAFQVLLFFSLMVKGCSEIDANISAAERVQQLALVAPEPDVPFSADSCPQPAWPQRGEIVFSNVHMSYAPSLPRVLKGVHFAIRPCEKIGVVGRTGAGKSSLIMGLFRLAELAEGSIAIDGVDIKTLHLKELRSRIAILPQEPCLFKGSLRSNLDPFDRYNDEELMTVAQKCYLDPLLRSSGVGLATPIASNGANISLGTAQLVCLARALLNKSRVLVLDEATAALDLETDAAVQRVIRREFADRTIITIAHRLDTIIDSDRILVMNAGIVAEFDSPTRLLGDPGSIFSQLCKQAGPHQYEALRQSALQHQRAMSALAAEVREEMAAEAAEAEALVDAVGMEGMDAAFPGAAGGDGEKIEVVALAGDVAASGAAVASEGDVKLTVTVAALPASTAASAVAAPLPSVEEEHGATSP